MQVAEHLSSVTIHGLSRAARVKTVKVRIFWTILFTAASIGFICHLSLLIKRFSSTPINTLMIIGGVSFEFPNMFICNPFPVSPTLFEQSKSLDSELEKINKSLNKIQRALSIYGTDHNLPKWMASSLENKALFASGVLHGSHTKQQTIIKATYNDHDLNLTAFQAIPNEEYMSCLKFTRSDLLKTSKDILTLYLYADINAKMTAPKGSFSSLSYTGRSFDDKSNSLWVYFTDKDIYPAPSSLRLAVSCGMHTHIVVSMTKYTFIDKPGDNCQAKPKLINVEDYLEPTGSIQYRMNVALCKEYEWSNVYRESCGCVPLHFPISSEFKHRPYRCLNTRRFSVDELASNLDCMTRLHKNSALVSRIEHKCHGMDPCLQHSYSLQSSSATWPAYFQMNSFFNNIFLKNYHDRLSSGFTVPAWNNVLKANESLQQLMIRENIVKLDISPRQMYAKHIIEEEAYPAINFFSDIGGILGLYLGMSLLSLIELFESVVLMLEHLWLSRKKQYVIENNVRLPGNNLKAATKRSA